MEKGDAGGGGGGDGAERLTYKTWILRVSIHCVGCKKKVKKVLRSIEGVYKIEIDSQQHKVVVTGNVESGPLIKKLIRSGKTAELWSEKEDEATAGEGGEKKVDQANAGDSSGEENAEDKGGGQSDAPQGGGGGGKKKKKKKKKKKGNAGPAAAGGVPEAAGGGEGSPPAAAEGGEPVEATNESGPPPRQQVISYPQYYYPSAAAAEYGMSYNHAPPSASTGASYYTLPVYNYTYLSPHSYPNHLVYGSIMDVNRYDDETGCVIT